MKFYDKDIYKKSEKIKAVIIVMCAFAVGVIAGYFVTENYSNKIENSVKVGVENVRN